MITITQSLNKKSITASITIKQHDGERTSYYRPNKAISFKGTIVNKDTINAIENLAMLAHQVYKAEGRAYKNHVSSITKTVLGTDACYLVNLNLLESIKAVKSKAQLDSLLYDLICSAFRLVLTTKIT